MDSREDLKSLLSKQVSKDDLINMVLNYHGAHSRCFQKLTQIECTLNNYLLRLENGKYAIDTENLFPLVELINPQVKDLINI